jgi:hypothetical protein
VVSATRRKMASSASGNRSSSGSSMNTVRTAILQVGRQGERDARSVPPPAQQRMTGDGEQQRFGVRLGFTARQ